MSEPRKPGRPRLSAAEARSARLDLRVKPADRDAWTAQAKALGVSLPDWIISRLNRVRKATP